MEIISLYYFLKLCEDFNMTKTSSRLFISQQTLSNHIRRLEGYYQAQLFHRKPTLSLTYAGELVLEFAKKVIEMNVDLKNKLSDIEKQERGIVRFGASTTIGLQFLPQILPEFTQKYPYVEIRYTNQISSILESMILNGELDFAVAVTNSKNDNLLIDKLFEDPIYLCIPEELFRQYYGREEYRAIKSRSLEGANIKDFERLPFSILTNRLGGLMNDYFIREKFKPNIYFTGTYTDQAIRLSSLGLSACYCSHMILVENLDRFSSNVNIFPILDQGKPIFQNFSLIRHRQRYLTRYAEQFMDILYKSLDNIENIDVTRIVEDTV